MSEQGDAYDKELAEFTEYMFELRRLEDNGERCTFSIGPYAAMCLIGCLQLATRHPGLSSSYKDTLYDLAHQFDPLFAGTLGEKVIRAGWDPGADR